MKKNTTHKSFTDNSYLNTKQINLLLVFSLFITAIIYAKVFKNSLTNWDDEMYIFDNPFIRSLSFKNLINIFSHYFAGNYHPLTLITYAINFKISHLQPWSYQLFNVIFHLCNVWLVFVFIKKINGLLHPNNEKYGLVPVFTALLFSIHTLQVESVAWISERKNVLYAFFFLLSLVYYLKYLENHSLKRYIVAIILFLLSLLSKGMAVPLSICIIAIDYIAGRNILTKKVIIEKLPFIALSIIFGMIALHAQKTGGATVRENYFSLTERFAVASYGLTQYILKLIYPYNLSAFYPYPVKLGMPLPPYFYLYLIVPAFLVFVIWQFFKKNKLILFGIIFFAANIILVIQIIPVGDAVMADRYVYLPLIGFFLVICYYFNELLNKFAKYQIPIILAFIVYGYAIGYQTYQRIGIWRNSFTLWNDALKKFPENNDRGYLNRGNVYYDAGNFVEALRDYNELLKIDSLNSGGYIGRALVKQAMNEYDSALEDYTLALSLKKTHEGYLNRAVLKMILGNYDEAWHDLDSAYMLNPLRAGVSINKGIILYEKEKYPEAIEQFNLAIQKEPSNYKSYIGRGKAKHALEDFKGALDDFNVSLSLFQSFEGFLNRAALKISIKDFEGVRSDLNNAYYIKPNRSEIFINLGILEIEQNNYQKATEELEKALDLNPNDYKAYFYLGLIKFKQKEYNEAIEKLNKSNALRPDKLTYYYRGLSFIELKDNEKACNDLNKALSMGYKISENEIKKACK